MNIKKSTKTLFLLLFPLLFCHNIKVFSQNLSLEELLNLQKDTKENIGIFLKNKAWIKEYKLDYIWLYENSHIKDSIEAMFVLRDVNCKKNIL